jgi:hypothetical protein
MNIAAQVPGINPADLDLAGLARHANQHHANALGSAENEVFEKMAAGDMLNEACARPELKGRYEDWVRKNTKFNLRVARRYRQLADARAIIEQRTRESGRMSIAQALRLIAPKNPKAQSSGEKHTPGLTVPTEIDSEAAAIAWIEKFLEVIPQAIGDALEQRLVVPPSKTAEKRRRDDAKHTERLQFRTREEALEAVRESLVAKDRDKRSAEADARRAKFYDANAEPALN